MAFDTGLMAFIKAPLCSMRDKTCGKGSRERLRRVDPMGTASERRGTNMPQEGGTTRLLLLCMSGTVTCCSKAACGG